MEVSMPVFNLKLHDTYYKKGFFNVPVNFERYVRRDNGPVDLVLGASGQTIQGRVDRNANSNGTPRVRGGAALRDWFQSNFLPKATVDVDLGSRTSIRLR